MKKYFIFALLIIMFHNTKSQVLETVPNVDLARYVGKWYEIASFPQRFQRGCKCTTAEYVATGKDYIKVINKCSVDGKQKGIEGKAFIVKNTNNAKLKVQFFWPLSWRLLDY